MKMFSEADLLLLYDKNTSFLWLHRKQIIASIEHLKTKKLYFKSKTMDDYIEYNQIREQIKLKKAKSLKFEESKKG